MLYAGLDLSRRRLDVCVLDEDGATLLESGVSLDADACAHPHRAGGTPAARAGARGRRVDDRRPCTRPLCAGAARSTSPTPSALGHGAAGGQNRLHRRLAISRAWRGATWCRPSGCRILPSALSANAPASDCTSSVTGWRSGTGSTPR
jgi:hypothetical protein